jgi:hypothetical protein
MSAKKYTVPHGRCCGLLWYVTHTVGGLEVIDDMFPTQRQAEADARRRNGDVA